MNNNTSQFTSPCPPEKCTGCKACVQICPANAIKFVENAALCSTVPDIDVNRCKNCNLCLKTCPQNSASALAEPESCHAAWVNTAGKPTSCSSGGIAYALSEFILKQGGQVCGCAMIYGNARHIIISELKDLPLLCGSKYVQSDINDCFSTIKQLLAQDKTVLFIGTPCQIDGLYHLVDRDHPKLFTVDLICHGVPIQSFWHQWAASCNKSYRDNLVSFRNGTSFNTTFYDKKTKISKQTFLLSRNYYLSAFLTGISYRENCYSCRYAQSRRIGDITLGDFWGLNKKQYQNCPETPSLVLINTDKGKSLFESLKNVESHAEDLSLALQHNGQLRAPMPKPVDRANFIAGNPLENFNRACEQTPSLKEKHFSDFRMLLIKLKKLLRLSMH